MEGLGTRFVLTRRAKNVKRKRLFNPKPVPLEPPTKKTNWRWQPKRPCSLRFVDDGSLWAKINMYNAEVSVKSDGSTVHTKRDIATENAFNLVVGRAKQKGIKVNVQKTQMLLISDANSFRSETYIEGKDSETIRADEGTLKLLEFLFDQSPTVRAQVGAIKDKVRRRLWILRHLKSFGFEDSEIV